MVGMKLFNCISYDNYGIGYNLQKGVASTTIVQNCISIGDAEVVWNDWGNTIVNHCSWQTPPGIQETNGKSFFRLYHG